MFFVCISLNANEFLLLLPVEGCLLELAIQYTDINNTGEDHTANISQNWSLQTVRDATYPDVWHIFFYFILQISLDSFPS